jgi:hypothetical protein
MFPSMGVLQILLSRSQARKKARYEDSISSRGNDNDPLVTLLDKIANGDQPSSCTSLQTTDSAGELMTCLQARHDRLSNCRKDAHGVGDTDEVNDCSTKMQKEMDELEEAQLDNARRYAAVAVAVAGRRCRRQSLV